MELENVRERQAAGIAAAKARGVYKRHGRKRGTTKSDPRRARELRAKGLKPEEIAKALGVGRSAVYEYLRQDASQVYDKEDPKAEKKKSGNVTKRPTKSKKKQTRVSSIVVA